MKAQMFFVLLTVLGATPLFGAGIGLLDNDIDTFDIKEAAVIKMWDKTEAGKDPRVVFGICKSPEEKFDGNCLEEGDRGITAWLPFSQYREKIFTFLRLKKIEDSEASLKKKEKKLEWLRKQFSEKAELGELDYDAKTQGDLMLLKMADNINTASKQKDKENPRKKLFLRILSLLKTDDPKSNTLSEVIFRQVEKEDYEAAIYPFLKWIEENICVCRKLETNGEGTRTPAVGLTVGKKVLGWFPSDNDNPLSREVCEKGGWKKSGSVVGDGVRFEELLDGKCKGYFSVSTGEPW
jgi:hypothetical protein